MNCRYFLCRDHHTFIDAGYRWAYWQLEHSGLVTLAAPVEVAAVLAAKGYWQPPAEERSDYLDDLLPRVRGFLDRHSGHELLYVESDWLFQMQELGYDYKEQTP